MLSAEKKLCTDLERSIIRCHNSFVVDDFFFHICAFNQVLSFLEVKSVVFILIQLEVNA